MAPKGDEVEDVDLNEGATPPAPPLALEVTGFDSTSASLKWKPPTDDGGLPITAYVIEFHPVKRGGVSGSDQEGGAEENEEWLESERIKPTKFPNGMATGLETGEKYEFRVGFLSMFLTAY